jgi:hypothetical protein
MTFILNVIYQSCCMKSFFYKTVEVQKNNTHNKHDIKWRDEGDLVEGTVLFQCHRATTLIHNIFWLNLMPTSANSQSLSGMLDSVIFLCLCNRCPQHQESGNSVLHTQGNPKAGHVNWHGGRSFGALLPPNSAYFQHIQEQKWWVSMSRWMLTI